VNSGYVPLGGVIVDGPIAKPFQDHVLWPGLTYSGHALACAAGIATLDVYRAERVIENAARMGDVLMAGLRELAARHPSVGDVRGKGLMCGIEVRAPGGELGATLAGQWLAVGMMERRVVTQVGTQAPEVVRAEPPLIAERADVDRFVRFLTSKRTAMVRELTGEMEAAAAKLEFERAPARPRFSRSSSFSIARIWSRSSAARSKSRLLAAAFIRVRRSSRSAPRSPSRNARRDSMSAA
jgi:hypothetical protein